MCLHLSGISLLWLSCVHMFKFQVLIGTFTLHFDSGFLHWAQILLVSHQVFEMQLISFFGSLCVSLFDFLQWQLRKYKTEYLWDQKG